MGSLGNLASSGTLTQILVGLSRTTILFIVSSGLTLILGVLRIPNIAHGSLYMIGAFVACTVIQTLGGGMPAFWAALTVAPLAVAALGFVLERGFFSYLYDREHLMLLLLTFSFALILGDLVKIVWGAEYRSVTVPAFFQGSAELFGLPLPYYNLFLLLVGPVIAVFLWLVINRTRMGKIALAAAVDSEMVSAVGINVGWVFAFTFVLGCALAGLGGALIAPMVNISLGMDHSLIMEAFLIVIMGGLGNIWGALLGSLIFGLTQSLGILAWPQFGIVFPYLAVVVVLLFRPKGLLRSTW
ncbi:MAG: branched-chain amino acid ABC-type transport system, permease component [Deltaproteobacteria bacterium]|jgi:branched-subunit amino acid ABC-type transport system permease component|nr:branched-chain amino acid ABC-type transport system, permease component [Deltaproteobacteria bacterium]